MPERSPVGGSLVRFAKRRVARRKPSTYWSGFGCGCSRHSTVVLATLCLRLSPPLSAYFSRRWMHAARAAEPSYVIPGGLRRVVAFPLRLPSFGSRWSAMRTARTAVPSRSKLSRCRAPPLQIGPLESSRERQRAAPSLLGLSTRVCSRGRKIHVPHFRAALVHGART
jgi:hypothetical protein